MIWNEWTALGVTTSLKNIQVESFLLIGLSKTVISKNYVWDTRNIILLTWHSPLLMASIWWEALVFLLNILLVSWTLEITLKKWLSPFIILASVNVKFHWMPYGHVFINKHAFSSKVGNILVIIYLEMNIFHYIQFGMK